tara:strand:- start:1049 stop:2356 length:1308 start_codon:yes stop_codon:yes gene_type:complete
MSIYQVGLAAQNNQNQPSFNSGGGFSIDPVRVKFTFLDINNIKTSYPKLAEKYGTYDALSCILFDSFQNPTLEPIGETFEDNLVQNFNFARPLFPNMRQVPLINEIVYIVAFPSVRVQDPRNIDTNQTDYYYFLPINLWNTSHQNAFPDPVEEFITQDSPALKNDTYSNNQAGSIKNTTQPQFDTESINLGNTFLDKDNIHNLQPYEGDIIYEGRWGQSIRFGSTIKNQNPWSDSGQNGDPILILRNGASSVNTEAWVPVNENINEDSGSIYFGTTQQLPINVGSSNYNSYPSNPPTIPNQYSGSQIIINSGRVLINSQTDHVMFSSGKSINLNAAQSINIDTDSIYFQSNKMYLGSKDADEPLLLGNATVDVLNSLIDTLKQFMDIAGNPTIMISTPPGTPLAPLNAISQTISNSLTLIQRDLDSIKSKDNFTI